MTLLKRMKLANSISLYFTSIAEGHIKFCHFMIVSYHNKISKNYSVNFIQLDLGLQTFSQTHFDSFFSYIWSKCIEMVSKHNNTTSIVCEPTEFEWGTYSILSWWMDGVASPVISSAGLLLNILACVTLSRSKNIESIFFNRLLICLTIFDNLYLSNGILRAIKKYGMASSYIFDFVFIKMIFPIRSMVMFCSMYTTIILAYVRHNAIKHPLRYKIRSTQERSRPYINVMFYIVPILLSSVLFYFPKFFEFGISFSHEMCKTDYNDENTSDVLRDCPFNDYLIEETSLRKNKNYIFWYSNVFNHIVTIVMPLILLVFFNYGIYMELNVYRKRQPSSKRKIRDVHATKNKYQDDRNEKSEQSFIIISLVIMFVICHLLRAILNVQELVFFEWKFKEIEKGCAGVKYWAMLLVPLSEFMLLTNSSANFFIYFFFHHDFRHQLKSKRFNLIATCKNRTCSSWTLCGNVQCGNRELWKRLCSCQMSTNQSFANSDGQEKSKKIEMESIVEVNDQ